MVPIIGPTNIEEIFSTRNNGISALRTCIAEGIVDCLEYLFSNLIEWIRITCET